MRKSVRWWDVQKASLSHVACQLYHVLIRLHSDSAPPPRVNTLEQCGATCLCRDIDV